MSALGLLEEAGRRGFHVLPEVAEEFLAQHPQSANYKQFEQFLLENDLRKRLLPALPDNVNTLDSEIAGPVVLQIVSVANISQPSTRQSEDSQPRVLQVRLTDGHVKCVGIEKEHIPSISAAKTAPGSKARISNCQILHGKLLLTPNSFEFLGGHVEQLYTSWRANRETAKLALGVREGKGSQANDPPPPFAAFSDSAARPQHKPPNKQEHEERQPKKQAKDDRGAAQRGGAVTDKAAEEKEEKVPEEESQRQRNEGDRRQGKQRQKQQQKQQQQQQARPASAEAKHGAKHNTDLPANEHLVESNKQGGRQQQQQQRQKQKRRGDNRQEKQQGPPATDEPERQTAEHKEKADTSAPTRKPKQPKEPRRRESPKQAPRQAGTEAAVTVQMEQPTQAEDAAAAADVTKRKPKRAERAIYVPPSARAQTDAPAASEVPEAKQAGSGAGEQPRDRKWRPKQQKKQAAAASEA